MKVGCYATSSLSSSGATAVPKYIIKMTAYYVIQKFKPSNNLWYVKHNASLFEIEYCPTFNLKPTHIFTLEDYIMQLLTSFVKWHMPTFH